MQEQCFPFPILQCMQYLWEPAQWYGCQCLICTQMWMPALAHGGCMNTIRESTLTADCEKIPCCTGELNPFWYCIWLLVHYTHFGIASGFWSTVPILVLHLAFGPLNLFWYCVWLLVHWTHFGIASDFWSTEPILVLRLACGPTLPTELFLPPPTYFLFEKWMLLSERGLGMESTWDKKKLEMKQLYIPWHLCSMLWWWFETFPVQQYPCNQHQKLSIINPEFI